MKRKIIIASVLFVFALGSCTNSLKKDKSVAITEQQQSSTDNNMATEAPTAQLPSFSIKDVNENIVNMQSLKGKKVFVNLWASWCPPCKREMPSIEKLYQSLDSSKVKFVLISFDDQFDIAKKYVSSKKLKLPIYYPTENPPALFNVQGIPATFIFNEKGELVKQIEGMEDYNTKEYKALLQ